MQLNLENTGKAGDLNAARARDRWTWVSKARSLTASSLELRRAGTHSGFYLVLPHELSRTPRA